MHASQVQEVLTGHECVHATKAGYTGKNNGELLTAAEKDGFYALLALDRGSKHQQNLGGRHISVLILRSKSTKLVHLEPAVPTIVQILSKLEPSSLYWVECWPKGNN